MTDQKKRPTVVNDPFSSPKAAHQPPEVKNDRVETSSPPAKATPVRGSVIKDRFSESATNQPAKTSVSGVIREQIERSQQAEDSGETGSNALAGIKKASFSEKTKDIRTREPVVSFRCIPERLKEQIDEVAMRLDMPTGLLTLRLFLHGIQNIRNGQLELEPKTSRAGRTLYPASARRAGRPIGKEKNNGKKSKADDTVAFRGIPKWVKDDITEIAQDERMKVPVGEVARAILEYSLRELKTGRVFLENPPVPTDPSSLHRAF